MTVDTLVLNTAELVLKGGNRRFFEKQLLQNVRHQLSGSIPAELEWRQAGLYLTWPAPLPQAEAHWLAERLSHVFGVAYVSLAHVCPPEMSAITDLAVELMAIQPAGSFKVECRRQDKRLPFRSPEVARELGAAILRQQPERPVQLRDPEITLRVALETDRAVLSVNSYAGPGGLPVGTAGRLTGLLSGGIDSPVAAWRLASRGCRVDLVHFHSYPLVSQASLDKVRRLAGRLARWQVADRLVLIPLLDIQKQIVSRAAEADRVLLYRRAMLKLAAAWGRRDGSLGLVTGDSVGQVASQTLENIAAVNEAVSLPVFRPLCGNDKESVVQAAKRIGTYNLSIEPHDDCCSLFTPAHPNTKAGLQELLAEEAACELEPLLETALGQAMVEPVTADWAAGGPETVAG